MFLLPGHTFGFIWLAIISITLTFFIAWKLPTDPDLFWHLRAGADILQRGIPKIDWYSHTFSNFSWIDHEYAQEVFMHFLEKLGGFKLISLFYTGLVTATLSAGLKWAWPRLGWRWVLVLAPLIAFLARPYLGARPQMVAYLFVLLLLGLLVRSSPRNLEPKKSTVAFIKDSRGLLVWLIPPLFALWANLHASFLIGLFLVLVVLIARAVKFILPARFKTKSGTGIADIYQLAGSLALSIAATFINPYGPRLWLEIARTLQDQDLHNNIFEWFSPDIHNANAIAFFVVILLLFITLTFKKNKNDLTQVLLAAFLMGTAFLAVRNIPLFLLVALPLIGLSLQEYWPRLTRLITKPWLVLLVLSVLVPLYVYKKVPLSDLWQIDRDPKIAQRQDKYPAEAAAFLNQHPEYQDLHGFNDYGWGGYLLKNVSYYQTFIDGRMPSWQKGETKIIDEYFKIDRVQKDWLATLNKYDVRLFITHPSHKIIPKLLETNFKKVYEDNTAVILVVDK